MLYELTLHYAFNIIIIFAILFIAKIFIKEAK